MTMHKRETRWIPGNIGAPTKGSRHVHTLAESRGGPRVSHTGTEDPVRPDQSVYPPQCCLEVWEMRSDVAGNVWCPLFYVIAQRIGTPTNMFATSFHLSPPTSIVVSI